MGKWIKKVTATPLGLAGHIIDSLSGSSINNAPSIRAVNAGIEAAKPIYVHAHKEDTSDTIAAGTSTDIPKQVTLTLLDLKDIDGQRVNLSTLEGLQFVPIYLDRHVNTPAGLIYNLCGVSVDVNEQTGDKVYIDFYLTNPTASAITYTGIDIVGLLAAYR